MNEDIESSRKAKIDLEKQLLKEEKDKNKKIETLQKNLLEKKCNSDKFTVKFNEINTKLNKATARSIELEKVCIINKYNISFIN